MIKLRGAVVVADGVVDAIDEAGRIRVDGTWYKAQQVRLYLGDSPAVPQAEPGQVNMDQVSKAAS